MKKIIVTTALGVTLCCAACSSSTTRGSGTAHSVKPAGGSTRAAATAAATSAPGSSLAASSNAPAVTGSDKNSWCGQVSAAGSAIIDASDPTKLPPDWQQKAEALAASAPSAIRADVVTLVKGDEKIINGDANADTTPAFLQAGERVVTWLETNCPGLMASLNPGLPTDASTG